MPKKLPKNKSWISLTKGFVKEWPEILDGLHFTNMPVKYLLFVDIILKNNITIHYDIRKELRIKPQERIAKFLRTTIIAVLSIFGHQYIQKFYTRLEIVPLKKQVANSLHF